MKFNIIVKVSSIMMMIALTIIIITNIHFQVKSTLDGPFIPHFATFVIFIIEVTQYYHFFFQTDFRSACVHHDIQKNGLKSLLKQVATSVRCEGISQGHGSKSTVCGPGSVWAAGCNIFAIDGKSLCKACEDLLRAEELKATKTLHKNAPLKSATQKQVC